MQKIEFEVRGSVPPRNVGSQSMWNNETEVPRLVAMRKEAIKVHNCSTPITDNVKLYIEIHIPSTYTTYNPPGDLDNFIKGICDSLCIPKKSLDNKNFPIHEEFEKPENEDIHPERFTIIEDDEQIVEIHAKKLIGEDEDLFYRIKIEKVPPSLG